LRGDGVAAGGGVDVGFDGKVLELGREVRVVELGLRVDRKCGYEIRTGLRAAPRAFVV
jgi:hypothetical protein